MTTDRTYRSDPLDELRQSPTVSVEVAAQLLGIGRSTAHRAALRTGEVTRGVPVIRPSERRVRVLSRPLLEYLRELPGAN